LAAGPAVHGFAADVLLAGGVDAEVFGGFAEGASGDDLDEPDGGRAAHEFGIDAVHVMEVPVYQSSGRNAGTCSGRTGSGAAVPAGREGLLG